MRSIWLVALVGCGSVSDKQPDAAVVTDGNGMDTLLTDAPVTCAATPAGLKARYRGENNANDHTGTYNGATVGTNFTYVPGKFGSAFSLDGDDLVTIDDAEALWPGTQSLTLEGWIKTTVTPSSSALVCKYACGDQCPNNMALAYFCLYLDADGHPAFDFRPDTSNTISHVTTASLTLDDGNWHHLVGVRDVTGSVATLYVDGALAATITPGAAELAAMTDDDSSIDLTTIGGAATAGMTTYDTFVTGQIDDVAIYHSALTAAQVTEIYSAPDGKCL